mgnify:CR=1 FL=1
MFKYAKVNGNVLAVDFDALVTTNTKYSQTEIENALKNRDTKKLIEMSNYFYLTSGEYRRLIHSMANIHTFRYIYAPLITTKKTTKVEKAYEDVTNYLMNYNVEESNTYITFSCILNGVFYGYERIFDDITVLQELPSQYCRSQFDENGLHAIEFDFRYFDSIRNSQERLLMFERLPDEFLTLYNQYKAGTPSETSQYNYWRQLDINFTRCHYLTPDKTPLFANTFSEIVNLAEYKQIDKTRSKLEIYKILVQKIPLDKNTNEPVIVDEEAQRLHTNAKNMLGSDQLVDVLTTPAEVVSVDIASKGEKQRDIMAGAKENMFSSFGTSQLLFNSGTTSIGLTESIKNDESLITSLIAQYEKHYNTRLRALSKIKFFLKDLGITIYNQKEKINIFKESATLGGAKLPYLVASSNLRQFEVISLITYENDSGLLDLLIPLQSSYNPTGEAGRPETDTPSEETTKQRDKETQKTRANK